MHWKMKEDGSCVLVDVFFRCGSHQLKETPKTKKQVVNPMKGSYRFNPAS